LWEERGDRKKEPGGRDLRCWSVVLERNSSFQGWRFKFGWNEYVEDCRVRFSGRMVIECGALAEVTVKTSEVVARLSPAG
jgi:hypothetical protein